jgi:MFS family permease
VHRDRQLGAIVVVGLALPLATAGFAFSPSFALACVLLVVTGGLLVGVETLGESVLLTRVRDEFRGRAMSLFSAAAMGAPRLGGLLAGWVAGMMGAPAALALGALADLVCTLPAAWLVAAGQRRAQLAAAGGDGQA